MARENIPAGRYIWSFLQESVLCRAVFVLCCVVLCSIGDDGVVTVMMTFLLCWYSTLYSLESLQSTLSPARRSKGGDSQGERRGMTEQSAVVPRLSKSLVTY